MTPWHIRLAASSPADRRNGMEKESWSNLARTTQTLENILNMTKSEKVESLNGIFLILSDIAITLSVIADRYTNEEQI